MTLQRRLRKTPTKKNSIFRNLSWTKQEMALCTPAGNAVMTIDVRAGNAEMALHGLPINAEMALHTSLDNRRITLNGNAEMTLNTMTMIAITAEPLFRLFL